MCVRLRSSGLVMEHCVLFALLIAHMPAPVLGRTFANNTPVAERRVSRSDPDDKSSPWLPGLLSQRVLDYYWAEETREYNTGSLVRDWVSCERVC
ncbi:hypothetical protein B0H67DRAFT_372786 [Lasiosphaeris hirsuta]|uniref:Uncharacterized protein n=1 Tax=Lasiosphaeris hirsuta TaxID=260670 RepID=A0AA39ZWX3_9PEZI|nr:hypothetical protein B0H67DRAFT_372786 [Lasiosphaeris hirsuta]